VRTLVLHIGYPKTATTSIQQCLHVNRDRLRERGVYYPLTAQFVDHSHNRLVFALYANPYEQMGEADRDALLAALISEIDQCGCETAVLSSELFVRHLDDIRSSPRLMALLQRHKVHVVCFLRRQDTYLESLYTQMVWRPKRKLALSVDAMIEESEAARADYHAALGPWVDFLGREQVTTVVYEQARNGEGCVRAFLSRIGVDTEGLVDLDIRTNLALSGPLGTEIMRIVNAYAGLSEVERSEIAWRAKELDTFASGLPIPKRLFTPEQCERIGRRFLESNQRLAAEVVGQPLEGLWFSERAVPAPAGRA
jgi:hypothetical protein